MITPYFCSQRKKDLMVVILLARDFGLQGTPLPDCNQSKKLFNSLVLIDPSVQSGGRNFASKFMSEVKAFTVWIETP